MEAKPHRFIRREQIDLLLNITFPILVVPIGVKSKDEDPWEFVTVAGNIPALTANLHDAVMEQIVGNDLGWRFVPKSLWAAMAVSQRPDQKGDYTQAVAAFEKWLIENDYPFDRLGSDAE